MTPRVFGMEYVGVGIVTGLYGVSGITNAIIVDNPKTFDNVKKGIERITGEKEGSTGFRSIAGRQANLDFILVQIPPYPQAVVEAVTELYIFGVRRIIMIASAYRFAKKIPPRSVLVARGAVGLDGISEKIAGLNFPLIASPRLEHIFKSFAEMRFSDFSWIYAHTATLPSTRIRQFSGLVREIAGKRDLIAIDSVTAPLYALQYELSRLEALALLTLSEQADQFLTSTIVSGMDVLDDMQERISRQETILYMVALEVLKKAESMGGGV